MLAWGDLSRNSPCDEAQGDPNEEENH